jgi:hypothetical protein
MTRDERRERIYDLLMMGETEDFEAPYKSLPSGCPAWISLKVDRLTKFFEGYQSPSDMEYIKTMWLDELKLKGWKSGEERKQEFFDKLGKEAWDDDAERFFGKKEGPK